VIMVDQTRRLAQGLALLGGFAAVLVVMFLPILEEKNGLDYLDSLYNSISKGSANYFPRLTQEADEFQGRAINVGVTMKDEQQAGEAVALFRSAGAQVQQSGAVLQVEGDLGAILASCLKDAGEMYRNDGESVQKRYDQPARRVLYNWWVALTAMSKGLDKQEMFKESRVVGNVITRGVECAYNYYGVEAQPISTQVWVVVFSLVFYVVYTVWYGFAILFMFEGLGLQLEH